MVAKESLTLSPPAQLPPGPVDCVRRAGVGRTGGLVAYLGAGAGREGGGKSTVGFSAAQVKICHRNVSTE